MYFLSKKYPFQISNFLKINLIIFYGKSEVYQPKNGKAKTVFANTTAANTLHSLNASSTYLGLGVGAFHGKGEIDRLGAVRAKPNGIIRPS